MFHHSARVQKVYAFIPNLFNEINKRVHNIILNHALRAVKGDMYALALLVLDCPEVDTITVVVYEAEHFLRLAFETIVHALEYMDDCEVDTVHLSGR